MKYNQILQTVNTEKALSLLEYQTETNGPYINFICECGQKALMKAYGEKKNLWFCPKCRARGHIISLAMKIKSLTYEKAAEMLTERAGFPLEPIQDELSQAISFGSIPRH